MDITNYIHNNIFPSRIFPNGIPYAKIGQFGLDQGRFTFSIHIKNKPAIEVKKWGTWGENYNVIVLELSGHNIHGIEINNWNGFDFAALTCNGTRENLSISISGTDWNFKIFCRDLLFQRSSTYIL
jgi:hypothetical protein